MRIKNKKDDGAENKPRVKVDSLKLNKETVKDLSSDEQRDIKGGAKKVRTVDGCPYSKCTKVNCISQIYDGGPCGINSQLDCI